MLGLTFDKLVIVALIAAVIVGPQRLPQYAQRLAETVRAIRSFMDTARKHAEAEVGAPLSAADWEQWDIRRYDPRRVLREALEDSRESETADSPPGEPAADPPAEPQVPPEEKPKYIIAGSSGHPRRILVSSSAEVSLEQEDPGPGTSGEAAERDPTP